MNVTPVNNLPPSITLLDIPKTTSQQIAFPREIAIRIRTVNLLASKIVADIAPSFCKIIQYLDEPKSPSVFAKCEELFESAFIQEFSEEQIDRFLAYFFEHFDPNHTFIDYKNLHNEKAKNFLWECLIRYYCCYYVGFKTKVLELDEAFDQFKNRFDPAGNIILINPSDYKTQLEESFDYSMNVIPQFSSDERIQMKLLSISYAALLLTSLHELFEKNNTKLILEEGFSIEDLFEEIIAMLLQLPFMPSENSLEKQRYHDFLDSLDFGILKKKFLDELVRYLVDAQDPLYKQNAAAIYEVMQECSFLDFEIKEILENLHENKIKRM